MTVSFPERFNMADYFLYHNVEEGRENKTCLYFEDQTWTYGDAARLSNRAGNVLRELGADIEDRVLLILPDCPEFVWTWFGAARIGAVITMVNPLLPAADYEYYLDYTRARVAVVHESVLPAFGEAVGKGPRYLRGVLVVGHEGGKILPHATALDFKKGIDASGVVGLKEVTDTAAVVSVEEAIGAADDECTPADTRRDDIAIWLFTSGSTGHPKGAVHLQHDLPYNTEVFAKRTMGVCADDLTVSVPKLFFGYATGTNLLFPFAVGGATALFPERSTAEKMFEVIKRYRPTILTTVPTMINSMLNVPGAAKDVLSSLRFCYSAGEALPIELYERWMNAYGIDICDGIGSAEMFHIYITNRPGDIKPGSLGRIVEGYEAKIVDADDNEVPTDEMGTLKIKGDSAALCYWNAHEKSKETFAGDWCTTGDQFHVDASGYYWYHGRTDDMLKVSGVFVAPAEIENCLLQHEAVLECAVVGHEADGLVKPKAFVVLREERAGSEQLADEIKQFVKSRIAVYKYPRWVEFVPSLPKNDRGKIDRKKLKAS
ncbi:MAG TPA: benzoate-CoA ligase family protein [Pyrinomonadaceae bacterium]|nr:benzoate-CoA ligase family protein [Pyrinomonadaceae bacterium]